MAPPFDLPASGSGLGEDRLVAALLAQLPAGPPDRRVIVGAGADDCAVVRRVKRGHWQLLKTDAVIEGVHFTPDTPPDLIGWKALCRPLSDIAASGGKPRHALVTLALNRAATLDWATGLYAGIARAAAEFRVAVVGGDTAATPGPMMVSVCLTGEVARARCVTRSGGRAGDALFVTGRLGGSFSSGRHLTFRPRLAESRWLTKHFSVRAMMDLSDGLAADLPRLARASGTGYALLAEALPCHEGCNAAQALGDGEDYELLFALAPEQASRLLARWGKRFPATPLTAIGHLATNGVADGLKGRAGFDHFGGR